MKRVLVAVAVCVALSAWGQTQSAPGWTFVTESKADTKHYAKDDSESTFIQDYQFFTSIIFNQIFKDEGQKIYVVSASHKDCAANYGTLLTHRLDKTLVYKAYFALQRPKETVHDKIAEHICNIAWLSQIKKLIERTKPEIDYAGSANNRRLFDTNLAVVMKAAHLYQKDIGELLNEAHVLTLKNMAESK